jgi:hypothetical protein
MREAIIKLYKFDELNEKAKEKVLDQFRETNVDHDWWDFTVSDFVEHIEQEGFNVALKNVSFDLHGQGSGVAFECDVDVLKFLDTNYKDKDKYLMLREKYKEGQFDIKIIRTDTRYNHEYTMSVSINDYVEEPDEESLSDAIGEVIEGNLIENISQLGEDILERGRELARLLHKSLSDEYDYLVSDESVKESVEMNDFEFEEDGTLRR